MRRRVPATMPPTGTAFGKRKGAARSLGRPPHLAPLGTGLEYRCYFLDFSIAVLTSSRDSMMRLLMMPDASALDFATIS